MKVLVNGTEYDIRRNYLHRSVNPRIVLESSMHLSIQFDQRVETPEVGTEYRGYLVTGNSFKQVTITFREETK